MEATAGTLTRTLLATHHWCRDGLPAARIRTGVSALRVLALLFSTDWSHKGLAVSGSATLAHRSLNNEATSEHLQLFQLQYN